MEAEEFIKIYEYLKNEHEEEMAERYEEIMDVQYGVKTILEELQEKRAQLLSGHRFHGCFSSFCVASGTARKK